MAEIEFQESDVIFSDEGDAFVDYREMTVNPAAAAAGGGQQHSTRTSRAKSKRRKKKSSNSIPVNIPRNVFHYVDSDDFEEEYDEGEIIPPHVIVKRRIEGKMAPFSVCTGNGRTLKGRDLSHFRNSILRMTGFLET